MWRSSIRVGFSPEEMAGDEGIEVRRDSYRLRGDRGALVSHAISLQHLVVEERATRTYHGIDRLEPVRIGGHRVDGVFRPPSAKAPLAGVRFRVRQSLSDEGSDAVDFGRCAAA
jgi:hypothetical protein